MWKAMYRLALRLIHQFVVVHRIDGRVLEGILVGANKKGLFLEPLAHVHPISGSGRQTPVSTAEMGPADELNATPVFYGPLFVPFALVASFAAGSLLGAAASRPPYPPPYPPYSGYGYGYPPVW
jgi:hypothetical protein